MEAHPQKLNNKGHPNNFLCIISFQDSKIKTKGKHNQAKINHLTGNNSK